MDKQKIFEQNFSKEKEPKIKSSMILNFLRHAEKDEDGFITKEGIKKAEEAGKNIDLPNDLTIASYFTKQQRTKQTLDAINEGIESQTKERDLNVNFREPVCLSSKLRWNKETDKQLKDLNKNFRETQENQSFTKSIEWWLFKSNDTKNVDNWTKDFLRALVTFLKLGTKLKENNHLMLNFVTHSGAPDRFILALLNQKGILKEKDSFENLGEATNFLEKINIVLTNLDTGKTKIIFSFRDYKFELEIEELKRIIENL